MLLAHLIDYTIVSKIRNKITYSNNLKSYAYKNFNKIKNF